MPDIWMDVDAALSEVPVNILPLLDDTDFKTRETAVAFNAAGMDLVWNFVTPAGAYTQTAVTPTSAGDYDWAHQGDGMYSIEIPAAAGASINNDTEGFGWFTGLATGVLPWRGPVIGFRAAGLNDAMVESAYSTTRGLAGTALPAVAAEGAGGLYTRGAGAGQIAQSNNGRIDADVKSIANALIAAATFAAGAIDAAAIATNAFDADALAADAVTEIWAKACVEPAAVVAAAPTAIAALSWLLTLSRNKIEQTSAVQTLKADDASTTIATAALSDDGTTHTRGEFA